MLVARKLIICFKLTYNWPEIKILNNNITFTSSIHLFIINITMSNQKQYLSYRILWNQETPTKIIPYILRKIPAYLVITNTLVYFTQL